MINRVKNKALFKKQAKKTIGELPWGAMFIWDNNPMMKIWHDPQRDSYCIVNLADPSQTWNGNCDTVFNEGVEVLDTITLTREK